jgi:hypothetical protein
MSLLIRTIVFQFLDKLLHVEMINAKYVPVPVHTVPVRDYSF